MVAGRFRHYAACGACGYSTEAVRFERLAVKLWNEAR
jgi:hypothetical protein